VIQAVAAALANFDHFASKALIGAQHYAAHHGPAQTVDAILGYASSS
jgi:hypothetical protein